MSTNENNYGKAYLPHYEGQIDLSVDSDGHRYTVNQQLAEFHYMWQRGSYGIGYYLTNEV